jgi:hypothetical protein
VLAADDRVGLNQGAVVLFVLVVLARRWRSGVRRAQVQAGGCDVAVGAGHVARRGAG